MPAQPIRLRLEGYTDAERVGRTFMSSMVDVAYIDEVTPGAILVVPDDGIDLDDPKDLAWVTEVIVSTLKEVGQDSLNVSVERTQA